MSRAIAILTDLLGIELPIIQAPMAALKSDAVRHTALTNLFTGRPARGIMNRIMRELGPMSDAAPAFPLATSAIAPLRVKTEAQGSGDFSPLWSGQNASGCKQIPAAERYTRPEPAIHQVVAARECDVRSRQSGGTAPRDERRPRA
jgi:NAD(P)H-dependent flavin oxidoreductase YrpB (nitropropane dioxygenase family)